MASPSPTNGKNPKKQMQVKKPTTHPNHTKTRQVCVPKQLAQAQKIQRYIWLPIKSLQREIPTRKWEAVPKVLWKWQPKLEIIVPEKTDAFATFPIRTSLKQCISNSAVMQ